MTKLGIKPAQLGQLPNLTSIGRVCPSVALKRPKFGAGSTQVGLRSANFVQNSDEFGRNDCHRQTPNDGATSLRRAASVHGHAPVPVLEHASAAGVARGMSQMQRSASPPAMWRPGAQGGCTAPRRRDRRARTLAPHAGAVARARAGEARRRASISGWRRPCAVCAGRRAVASYVEHEISAPSSPRRPFLEQILTIIGANCTRDAT